MLTFLSIMCAYLFKSLWTAVDPKESGKETIRNVCSKKWSHQRSEMKSIYATTRSSPNAGKLFAPSNYSRRKVVPPSGWVNSDSDLFKFSCINRVHEVYKTRAIQMSEMVSQWNCLDGSLDWWFVAFWSLNWNAFSCSSGCCDGLGRLASVTVKLQKLGQVETWLLQHLHLKR